MPEDTTKPSALPERVGKYEILSYVASGGMGVVYKARDVDLDRIVALKVLTAKTDGDQKALLRFRREAKASAQLRHENIVAIYDIGETNGTYFLALEFVEGTDLQNYIDRKCRLDPEEARQIIIQATHALVHAHDHKIVHRDIKPSNFMMTVKDKQLHVKLTDFGLAIRSENDAEFRVTRDGTTVGTVDYMSPEQARNSKGVDIRSDIYSLGCTFYHMLAGVAPFAKGTLPERLIHHMQSAPPDMRKLNKSIPESLIAIVNRMLAKKPDDRFQSPAELLAALENHDGFLPSSNHVASLDGEKTGRGVTRKVDPTIIVEKRDGANEAVEARPARTPLPRKAPAEAVAEKVIRKERPRKETVASSSTTDEAEAKPTREAVRRVTDDADVSSDQLDLRTTKKGAQTQPAWVLAAAGSLVALVLVLGLAIALGGRGRQKKDDDKPPPPPIVFVPPVVVPEPDAIDTDPAKMTVGPLPWPAMDPPPANLDRAALRKAYAGSVRAFPDLPAKVKTLQVRRLGTSSPTNFRTIADALAQADAMGWTIIDIHDDGPLYVPALPALTQRSIVLRGAAGHRPLLVWDLPKLAAKDPSAAVFLALTQGTLALDNLDVVTRGPDDRPLVLFDLREADFHARACTFSLVSKSAKPITVVQLRDARPEQATQVALQRCYLRGPELTFLRAEKTPVSLLVEDSLIVGQNQPLIDLSGRDEDVCSLHSIGSTFVAGQMLLRWRTLGGSGGMPAVNGHMLDSILSRHNAGPGLGDLLHLADGAAPARMTWKSANCVFAGWKKLLASAAADIAGSDERAWRLQWKHGDGDRVLAEPWPGGALSRLAEIEAQTFVPPTAPLLAYTAWSNDGALGCTIGRLPGEPASWIARAFDPPNPTPLGVDPDPPVIDSANDGLYHGDKLLLNEIGDLGVYLNKQLKNVKPAPRVVLHLFGWGNQPTSSLKVKGIQHLVLHFIQPNDGRAPLQLVINPAVIAQRLPLIDMTGGHLELVGARIQLSATTFVPAIIKLQGGDLTLTRCWLQGPLTKAPAGFEALISVANPAPEPATVLLRNNMLMSGKLLLLLQENVQVKARNNLFLSLGDGMILDAKEPVESAMLHLLDHNTWAIRHATFTFRIGPDYQRSAPMLLHAASNAFLNPFADELDKTALLRGAEPLASRGMLIWQGRYNVYDARLHAYIGSLDKNLGGKQTLPGWLQTWGPAGEQGGKLFEPGPMLKAISLDTITLAILQAQLDRLALPPELRGNPEQAPPGANLIGFGIVRKKF